jgi:tetratricopeptide (TPR) repeat protein
MLHIVRDFFLKSEIQRRRGRLAACPSTHPQRGKACHDLAISLYRSWALTFKPALLDEVIILHYEALALRPAGHPDRAMSCNNLALTLHGRYRATGSSDLLDEIIALHRETLTLRPAEHPDRVHSCNNLANALLDRYRVTGSANLLEEVTTLHREALALQLDGHPSRASSCNNLASALRERYMVMGGSNLVDEVITLYREALTLRPAGHPDRSISCNNLALALFGRYRVSGSSDLLDEIVKLHREALALQPAGHPDRAMSCNNLANVLMDRYRVTGSSDLLDEVITLHREAFALRPAGHPDRAMSCNNLALTLHGRYRVSGSSDLLNEIVKLHREALALQPVGHPDRASSCSNLAGALQDRYQLTGSSNLLDEIIALHREGLALRPDGHPYHARSCITLAEGLWQHFIIAKDVTVVDEALALAREAAASASPSDVGRAFLILVLVHTEQGSPHFSISTATEYLLQASASIPLTTTDFMDAMQSRLDRIWCMHGIWTPDTALRLLDVYSSIIDSLSRVTGFAFDAISQLTALRSARSFGSDACVAALLSGRPRQAIEVLDHAHGIIWAQALHQRDPQLQDIPHGLAPELEALFRAVSMTMATPQIAAADPSTGYLSPEDIRHQQNSRIQTILKEVRSIPGLERFMLGRTYAELRETAREHPVVVLVSARGHVYALIIHDATQEAPDELHLKITSDRLSSIRDTAARVGLRQGGVAQDLEMELERAMHISGHKKATALDTLADLWHGVVKPVVDHLQLQVRIRELRLPLSV